ncbi:hypothetical protein RISK_000318 [Rhodopirellula islandica]|uniref:Uncharacterized protein n=1 Tax=Rhodopirellula islandica TaxID=595434 RepID=A0A0J1BM98_RHOIS|nr:hypothetical protein RISK_000318 [Rhodopirellula islandica]
MQASEPIIPAGKVPQSCEVLGATDVADSEDSQSCQFDVGEPLGSTAFFCPQPTLLPAIKATDIVNQSECKHR